MIERRADVRALFEVRELIGWEATLQRPLRGHELIKVRDLFKEIRYVGIAEAKLSFSKIHCSILCCKFIT